MTSKEFITLMITGIGIIMMFSSILTMFVNWEVTGEQIRLLIVGATFYIAATYIMAKDKTIFKDNQ